MKDIPSSAADSASEHRRATACSRASAPSGTNVASRVLESKPLYLRFLRRSSSLFVMTGCLALTTLQCLGSVASMFCWTEPTYPVRDITSSSLIGSIGGFVTWANCWRK